MAERGCERGVEPDRVRTDVLLEDLGVCVRGVRVVRVVVLVVVLLPFSAASFCSQARQYVSNVTREIEL